MIACCHRFQVTAFTLSVSLIAACLYPPTASAETEGGAKTTNQSSVNLQEVVVTAQKRSENVQDVPETVTVLSPDAIAAQQLNTIEDITALVPGMSNLNTGAGQNQITLRGVTSGPTQLSTSVGIYLDDIPFGSSNSSNEGSSQTADFDTFDMARIEVLQGPQGTLYGANNIGGLIKYVTNAPDPAGFDALVNVGGVYSDGGGTGYSVRGMINIPIADNAAVRATAFKRRDPGFIDDNGQFPRSDINTNTYEGGSPVVSMEPHRNTVAAPHRTHARGLLRRNKCRRPRSDHTKTALWELYAASPSSGADRDAEQHAYPEHQLGHGLGEVDVGDRL